MTRLALLGLAGAAVLAALAAFHWQAWRAGRDAGEAAVSEQIEKDNDNAATSAEDWRARLRGCDPDGGKLFNFETGTCDD